MAGPHITKASTFVKRSPVFQRPALSRAWGLLAPHVGGRAPHHLTGGARTQREGSPVCCPQGRAPSSLLPEEPVLLGPASDSACLSGEASGRGRPRRLGLGRGSWTPEPPAGPSASGSRHGTSGLGFSRGSYTVTPAHTCRGGAGCGKPGHPTYSANRLKRSGKEPTPTRQEGRRSALNAGNAARSPAPLGWGRGQGPRSQPLTWLSLRGTWNVAGPRPEESSFRPLSSQSPGLGQGGVLLALGVCWGRVGGKAGNSGLQAAPPGTLPGSGPALG